MHASRKPDTIVQLLSGLAIGGKERAALRLATHGIAEGMHQELWLFDTPFRSPELDFAPGAVPIRFMPRGPGLDLLFVRRLARALAEARVDTLHAHNDSALCYGALAGALLRRRAPRLLSTFHTWPGRGSRLACGLTRWAAGRAATVAAVSDELTTRLGRERGLNRCATVWNGIDLDAFRPGEDDGRWHDRLGIAPGTPLVVHVGRFDPVKRHADVLTSALIVHAVQPAAVFVLAGDGPMFAEIAAQARAMPWVHLVGNVTDIAPLLRAARIFVLPSTHEPLALLEAMASGLACIGSAVGGMPTMLTGDDGRANGVLVAPGNTAALAAAIIRLLGDPALRNEMGRRARARAADFSFAREWETYRSLYAGVSAR
jgi:glycosyltransferase involved in cell wall biosynthesis